VTERWPKIVNIILVLVLILAAFAYVFQGIEYSTLRSSHEENLQIIQRQTQIIVDLRKTLTKESFQNFESEQVLRDWTANWILTRMPIVVEFFGTDIALRGQKYSMYQDCDDFAEAMQRDALKDSYILDKALVDKDGCVYGVKVSDLQNHIGIQAMTNNAYWYIEPQTGGVVKIVGRD